MSDETEDVGSAGEIGLVPRTDSIGVLARQLLGDDDTPPDPTAAQPLYEALIADGNFHTAHALQHAIVMVACAAVDGRLASNRRRTVAQQVYSDLRDVVGHLLFDFPAACTALARACAVAQKPPETKAGEVKTTRVKFDYPVGIGDRYPFGDGIVMVVGGQDAAGFADTIPVDEPAYTTDAEMPSGFPRPRRFA